MNKPFALGLALVLLAFTSACERTETTATPGAEQAAPRIPWDDYRDQFVESYFRYFPRAAVNAGRHEYDGQIHDTRPEAVREVIDWLNAQRAAALEYLNDEVPGDSAFERAYLAAAVDRLLFSLDVSGFLEDNPVVYTRSIDPTVYLTREYAPLPTRMAAFTTHAENIPAFLAQMQRNLRTPLARPHVETVTRVLGGLATFFEDTVPGIFADITDTALQTRFAMANSAAIDALNGTLTWLGEQALDDDFALGEERFLAMLRMSEGVEITLEDLTAAGEADLQRNLTALETACESYAPGVSVRDCVARAQTNKPEGGPVEGAREQLTRLREFLIQADIVSIPGTEEALVDEAPPYRRINFAYITIPGPYEENLPSTYYIAPPDPTWSEEDQQNYLPGRKDLLYTSVHEVWPGHFLQFLHANRADSTFGRLFFTYSQVEGWAHYTEQLMFDAGLDDGDPESHIGQLMNALLRNVRYLSAIGLHTGGMTVDESRAMFEEVALADYGNAIQQAVRGTYDPGYLNYTLGKLMINKLRDDWTASRGGRSAWKAFHDGFLAYGGPPIPLIRADMLGEGYSGDPALIP